MAQNQNHVVHQSENSHEGVSSGLFPVDSQGRGNEIVMSEGSANMTPERVVVT